MNMAKDITSVGTVRRASGTAEDTMPLNALKKALWKKKGSSLFEMDEFGPLSNAGTTLKSKSVQTHLINRVQATHTWTFPNTRIPIFI